LGDGHLRRIDQAALKPRRTGPQPSQWRRPLRRVLSQQLAFAGSQCRAFGGVLREPGTANLKTDELGPRRLALLLQPVGIHEPERAVFGRRTDCCDEALLLVHAPSGAPATSLAEAFA